jgi:hypothetical protein
MMIMHPIIAIWPPESHYVGKLKPIIGDGSPLMTTSSESSLSFALLSVICL